MEIDIGGEMKTRELRLGGGLATNWKGFMKSDSLLFTETGFLGGNWEIKRVCVIDRKVLTVLDA